MEAVAVGVVHAEFACAPWSVAKGGGGAKSALPGTFCMQCVGIVDEKAICGSILAGRREIAFILPLQVDFHTVAADPGIAPIIIAGAAADTPNFFSRILIPFLRN